MNFSQVAQAVANVAYEPSTLGKQHLLKEYSSIEGFKDILKFIYDPYFTTGIKNQKLERANLTGAIPLSPEDMMQFLKTNTTGTDYAVSTALSFIWSFEDDNDVWLATALVTKDLQIGVSITTLNKVFGEGFIPVIGIMRGMHCPLNVKGHYIATEKIDGNRRLIFNTHDDGVKIYTRSGKPDNGLYEIAQEAALLPKGYVFDTECIAIGDFADSIELRQASASILNSRGKRTGVKALVFDMLPIEEYNRKRSKYNAWARKAQLAYVCGEEADSYKIATYIQHFTKGPIYEATRTILSEFAETNKAYKLIRALPILGFVENYNEALDLAVPIWDSKGEGIMLVDVESPYEVNPNPRGSLLKVKATKEYNLKCVDIVAGDNKYTGMLGAIVVEYNRAGITYPVKVGSGFTDYERQLYFNKPGLIVGKFVEIETFGESQNASGAYSLNCPIFKRIQGARD